MSRDREKLATRINDEYAQVSRELDGIVYALDRLYDDVTAIELGWKCRIAIDFFQLFQLAFPATDLMAKTGGRVPEKHELDAAAFAHAKTRCAFDLAWAYGDPVLLPPHMSELRNTLARHWLMSEKERAQAAAIKMANVSAISVMEERIAKLLAWARRERQGDDRRNEAFSLFVEETARLSWALYAEGARGFSVLAELFKDGTRPHVKSVSDVWPLYSPIISTVGSKDVRNGTWYAMFQEVRREWDSDYRDALAIEMVLAINDALSRDQQREYFVIHSDARSMFTVLNWDLDSMVKEQHCRAWQGSQRPVGRIALGGSQALDMRLLRNSDGFLMFRALAGDEQWPSAASIHQERTKLSGYKLLRSTLGLYVDDNNHLQFHDTSVHRISRIESDLSKYRDYLAELKETRLARVLEVQIRDALNTIHAGLTAHNDLIRRLNDHPEEFWNIVEERETELANSMRELEDAIRQMVVKEPMTDYGRVIGSQFLSYNLVPFGIRFRNKTVNKYLDMLSPERIQQDPHRISQALRKLLGLVRLDRKGEEDHLLLGLMLMAFGEWGTAVYVLGQPGDWSTRHDFNRTYLMCLAWHQKSRERDSEFCRQEASRSMARLLDMKVNPGLANYIAGLVWVHWVEQGAREKEPSLRRSIEYSTSALGFLQGKTAHVQAIVNVHNNILWAKYLLHQCAGSASGVTQEELLEGVAKLEAYKGRWMAMHYDTAVTIYDYLCGLENDKGVVEALGRRADALDSQLDDVAAKVGIPATDRTAVTERQRKRRERKEKRGTHAHS